MSSLGAKESQPPIKHIYTEEKKSTKITIQEQNINKKGQKLYIQNKKKEKRGNGFTRLGVGCT